MRRGTNQLYAAVCAMFAWCVADVAAAQSYPSRPIRLICPFASGGGADATARLIAQALFEQMGQQVIVDNRGGAGGRIGMEMVAKAPADGYTLILGNVGPFSVLPAAGIGLRFDPLKDFQPVSLLATSDYILAVHPSLPARSVAELLALARTRPAELTYGSSGPASGPHLAGELMNVLGRVRFVHVPYKGNGPAAFALLTGEISIMFGRGAVLPHLESGKLRALATTASKRSIPALPTIAETLPGYEIVQWYGILVAAGTPREIVTRLNKEIGAAMARPKVAQGFIGLGTDPAAGTTEEFSALLKAEAARYARLIKAAGIVVE